MRIAKIEIIRFRRQLIDGYESSVERFTYKDSILVKLHTVDGLVGYGEAATLPLPLYGPEYAEATFLVLRTLLAPLLIGKDAAGPEEFVQFYTHMRGWQLAKTAVETAFWHLYAQATDRAVWDLLGGTQTHVEVGASLGIKSTIEELLAEVRLRVFEGYRRIKVKIKPGWDLEPIRQIRAEFPDIRLTADANSAYSLEHIDVLKELDRFGLLMIEQPLGYNDIIDHAALQREIATPVCLDESIISAEDARKALDIDAARIINIKPGRVGGLIESKKIHDLCYAHSIPVWCGGMLESCIGRFYNLSVAALPGYTLPSDMSPSSLFFKQDLVREPFEIKNGHVAVPTSFQDWGDIDNVAIDKFTTAQEVLSG